jgi:hypothetical protein
VIEPGPTGVRLHHQAPKDTKRGKISPRIPFPGWAFAMLDLSNYNCICGKRYRDGDTAHIDGNAQHIYFDDLTYTWTQESK